MLAGHETTSFVDCTGGATTANYTGTVIVEPFAVTTKEV